MVLCFDRFRFDRADHRLGDSSGVIPLNPKAFDVLRVLIESPGQLVRKEQILDAVWPDTHVADGVLKVCIAEIRKALGDSATAPRFIETVHRRGYRFVAKVTAASSPSETVDYGDSDRAASGSLVVWPAGGVPTGQAPVGLVGRGAELELLETRLARVLEGERQVVFVTGEAGAGKTALVEHFVTDVARRQALVITGSQCIEQFGSSEAYMPVLEAISRLVREDEAARALLRRYAPTWLAQLPWLIEDVDRDRFSRDAFGSARERMLREMAEFVEALGAQIPLVLVLDDLHWSDPSTVDLLSLLAGRRESTRLLVIGTYRPAELLIARHPLRAVTQRLETNPQCTEVSLDDLGVEAVAQYLERRFSNSRLPADVARLVRERTDGNPLFLVTLVDHLLARGALIQAKGQWQAAKELRGELAAVPESLRRLIGQQLERLQVEDHELLAAASLVGFEFCAAAAAAGAGRDLADAEERFEQLAGGPLLRRAGSTTWPDGTVAECFAFRHPLYPEVLANTAPARRRAETHLRIGTVLERSHGERSNELAAELALHFEVGGDRVRALRYRRLAAQTAADRHALAEVETHLEKALVLLEDLPASPERDREEALLQSTVGAVRMATRGYAAPEADQAFARALELSQGEVQDPSNFRLLWGMWTLHLVRAELDRALELAEQNRLIAEASGDRQLRMVAQHGLWSTHFFRGDLRTALRHLDAGEPLYDAVEDRQTALLFGLDLKVAALSHRSYVQWGCGLIDQALAASQQAVEHARLLEFPMSLANALVFAAWIRCCRREPDACSEHAEAVIAHATEHGLPYWLQVGLELRGWASVERGELERGIADLEQGLASWTAGAHLGRSRHLAHLAAAKALAGHTGEARVLLEECKALLEATGERYHEPEIRRLDAELVLAEAGGAEADPRARERAERLLQAAIDCANRQGARTLELRARTALARLYGRGAKGKQARATLADLLASFTEGFDTADLRDAHQLVFGETPPRRRRAR